MNIEESYGKTIQLFLVDGRPAGLRKATIHGWTGIMFIAGDAALPRLLDRAEVDRTGIYVLLGPDPRQLGERRVYIGSGNSVANRLRQSARERSFWDTVFAITTSDDDLSKGHAEYLEARLIEMSSAAKRVILDNDIQPDVNGRRLPEADVANMEQFLANISVLLPVVGLDMLNADLAPDAASDPSETKPQFEMRHRSGVKAMAVAEGGQFIVLQGSEALSETGSAEHTYSKLKERLIIEGVLEPRDGRLSFARSFSFASPSAAAAVVLDRSSNGRTEWKVRGTALTYADWQAPSRQTEAAQ